MKLDALFIASHPDDIEITCGGTCINIVKSGKKAGIIDLTEGELSSRGNSELRRKETSEETVKRIKSLKLSRIEGKS